jgi:glycosyl transferase family 2
VAERSSQTNDAGSMRWAIITGMYNVADLVTEFCTYHLGLGVDKIFVADYGSDDGTLDLLRPFVREGRAQIVTVPTHDFSVYDPSNAILKMIRADNTADWISFLDPDEFLTGPDHLKEYLTREWSRDVEAIALPRTNLMGVGPIPPEEHYLTHLTFKIVKADIRIPSASAPLSSPWIFSRVLQKVMVSAQSSLTVTPGDHRVLGTTDEPTLDTSCEILHLPMRSYEAFQEKIECGIGYFRKNPELGSRTGWHWRRWIELFQSGRLREEYEKQFPGPQVAEILLAEGRVVRETRLAEWWANDQ